MLKSAVAAAIGLTILAPARPAAEPVAITANAIDRFAIGTDQTVFGSLEFVGGLDLVARDRRFAGLSGIDVSADGRTAYMISDRGFMVTAGMVYRDGRLAAISGADVTRIFPDNGHGKAGNDAEDIAVFGQPASTAVISLERQSDPLIRFRFDGARLSEPEPVNIENAARHLPRNTGLESVASFPASSPYAGALLAISEGPRHYGDDDIDAWIVGVGTLRIAARDNFNITAARFLPGGDLLLLERRFTAGQGIGMRLRRIAGDRIRPGAKLDGAILLEAGLLQQIDNMEGLAVHRDAHGRTIITMVSDDNGSILQRTLLLQFALVDR
jgi:hypothetical protein